MDTNNRMQHNRSNKASILAAVSVLCAISILFIALTGCSSGANNNASTLPQPTLDELLAEINEEHSSVQRYKQDPTPYLRTSRSSADSKSSLDLIQEYINASAGASYNAELVLTTDQAMEDTNYLFDSLYDIYSLYDYFGGREVFETAREHALAEIAQRSSISCGELQNILLGQLGFIEEGHFSINNYHAAKKEIPFFFRERIFLKTDYGYQTADGKTVQAVDGYADLDDLFKRSISPNGELVYYPVILQECEFMDALLNEQNCNDTLTVRYSDGTIETLTAEPYQIYFKSLENRAAFDLQYENDIPVLHFTRFDSFTESELDALLAYAKELSDTSLSILDLRSNGGGYGSSIKQFIAAYTGRRAGIQSAVSSYSCYADALPSYKIGDTTQKLQQNLYNSESIRVILAGKYTASSAEIILDTLESLENVLIIGENTSGSMLTSITWIQLPNSKSQVQLGCEQLILSDSGPEHYKELRGLYPDIWVPAGEAEELAIKLIDKLS